MFKQNKLSTAIVAVLASVAGSNQAFAQDAPAVEEVVVTGIRASIQAAMDVKRDAAGVVDAISAEDMGKFPDTNLAESLQRITGVSISRTNGEGSEVTVRGFGGEFNMITLNGRTMPAANVYGGGSGAGGTKGGSTRAFDFANIASEGVSAVEVYKTGRASVATGGIGASINVKTARPLDKPGLQFSVGAKALSDSTNRTGSDVTPEVSGVMSWTDESDKFGVALSLSRQERDSGSTGVSENNWNIGVWGTDTLYSLAPGAIVTNPPAVGQLYGRPNDIRYVFSDVERTRTNAQLTLQFAPSDDITTTLDYTFAENDLHERRGESTSWLANENSINEVRFSDDAVASPLYIRETAGPRDQGYEQQLREQTNTLKSLGFNAEWNVNDKLTLVFDAHNSTMDSLPTGPGKSGEIAASLGAPVQTSHWLDFSGDLPLYNFTIDDGIQGTSNVKNPTDPLGKNYQDANGKDIVYLNWVGGFDVNPANPTQQFVKGTTTPIDPATAIPLYRGNNNDVLDAGDIGSQVVRIFYAAQTTDVTQLKLDGSLEFDNGKFNFGVESRSMEMTQQQSDRYMSFGDWGIANVGDVPTNLFENFNLSDFEDYDASRSMQQGFKGNAEDIAAALIGNTTYGYGGVLSYNPDFSANNVVKEDITAVYVELAMQGSIGDMETNFLAGFRYEATDVTSSSDMLVPTYLQWKDNNDFETKRQASTKKFSDDASYDNLLPSLDFDISFTDAIKGRASFSQTIARTSFGNLSPVPGDFQSGGGSVLTGKQPTANLGNPGLIPLESNNLDISAEWYFDDTSYASIGFFEKRVKNFVGTEQTKQTLSEFGDIRDVTSGPRAQRARDWLAERGIALDDTTLFVMTTIVAQGGTAADYVLDDPATTTINEKSNFEQLQAYKFDIDAITTGADADPETIWQVSKPINNREAKLYGSELAVQHFFGDSGFGVMANYTIVRGDVHFVDTESPTVSQFALLGLSDTANLVAMYENFGIQARLAFNWRDEYLNNASRGTSRNPVYVEAYSQWDLNVSYEVMDGLSVFFEGLNLTGENIRTHGRSDHMIEELYDLGARYALGARYTF